MNWVLPTCLLAGAVVAGLPDRTVARRRLRPTAGRSGLSLSALFGLVTDAASRRPWRTVASGASLVCALAVAAGGPVAGVVAAVYAVLVGRALVRRANSRQAVAARVNALDELAAIAADLRAGLPVPSPLASGLLSAALPASSRLDARVPLPAPIASAGRLGELASSVWRLAEQTGAAAADLVERIEADGRAADRAAASAAAQAAGAQATALLLAALPLGGIGLGLAIGANPIHVLLHTPLGAACAITAVLLQAGGLLWADRLASAGRSQ